MFMLAKIFSAYAWLLVSAGCIFILIAGSQFYQLTSYQLDWALISGAKSGEPGSALSRSTGNGVTSIVETADGRAEIVANFLERHKSPLQPYDHYGQVFVEIADRYGMDFRLLPAIAMQERNLCKVIPEGSYNCLGFGIHSRGTLKFDSYEANFERAAKELKANYINQGRITPEMIMKKYTPSSNGSWANSVNQWMAEMRSDDRESGRTKKTDANVLEFAQNTPGATTPTPVPTQTP